jgi:hypothetical protein
LAWQSVIVSLAPGECRKTIFCAFPEVDFESERLLVELQRSLDVADVQIDMVQSARFDHRMASKSAVYRRAIVAASL